ncbi:MAG: MtnX-like HAD-IB family phosphatase [Candidatus Kapaibacterium sp.]
MSIIFDDIKVFCDFDGTITLQDVGNELFKEVENFKVLNKLFIEEKLTIYEYWHKLCSQLPKSISIEIIKKQSRNFEIDPYFKNFVEFCKKNNLQLFVVSDGFDVYINEILAMNGIKLPVCSNKLLDNKTHLEPEFTNASESCKCYSANCKRNFVLNKSDENTLKIYIGDGYSDFCGASHCDLIFAKKYLAAYCNENSLPHYNFKSFFDVKRILEKKINDNNFKKRNRATVDSNNAYKFE